MGISLGGLNFAFVHFLLDLLALLYTSPLTSQHYGKRASRMLVPFCFYIIHAC